MDASLPSLFDAAECGDSSAAPVLFSALYVELHRMAARELARKGVPVSISATTLLHEAYLDMAARHGQCFPDCGRFMSYAARVMRGLIIDHARNRRAHKRGGQFEFTSIEGKVEESVADQKELTHISDALDELAKAEPALAEIVDLKFFCGFSFTEIAGIRGVCERTVQRDWEKARIYLHHSMKADLA